MNSISSKPLLTKYTNCAKSCIAAVCGSCLLCFGSAANADESSNVLCRASVEDLTPQQFDELAGLAVSLRATSSSSNITNDVADILAILNAVFRAQTADLKVISYGTSGVPLSSILKTALSENWSDTSQPRSSSFLYEIQRALYGRSGSPSQDDSVISLLKTIQTATTNNADVLSQLGYLSSTLGQMGSMLQYVSGSVDAGNDIADDISAMLYANEYGHGSEWAAHVNDSQWGDLLGAIAAVSNSVTLGIGPGFDQMGDAITNLQISLDAQLDDLRAFLATNLVAGSFSQLDDDVDQAMDTSDDGIEPDDLPDYEDLFTESSPDEETDAIEAGYDVLQDHLDAYSSLVGTGGDPQIVLVPEMDLGGIHVDEVKGSLDTPITSVVHGVMVFIWGVGCFAALFALASSEFAFYANLGRNWTTSKY